MIIKVIWSCQYGIGSVKTKQKLAEDLGDMEENCIV